MRSAALLALLGTFAGAPMQCPSPNTPERARDETPGEALWMLAERFAAEGNAAARTRTLEFLVQRYPSSRFALRARQELAQGTRGH